MSTSPSKSQANVRKHFSSSILLWMRTDQPRQTGMDHWKGPHSKIISATPGLEEYRQIHLAEVNPGLWPATTGVRPRRHRRAEGTANPDLLALEREALGHPERRARQPRRPAVPRITDLGLHGLERAGGLPPRP